MNLPKIYNTIFFWKKFKREHKRAFFVFLLIILITALPLLRNFLSPKQAQAAWFDENWGYREAIPATSTEGAAQTNVFLSFTLDTATPITAGKLQSSCQDIRITDGNGKLLKYHIGRVTACNNAATTIDFLLPSFPDGKSTYYVYYGNSVAPSMDAGTLTVSAASTATVTASGNEITDTVRAAQVQGDGLYPSATNLIINGGFETNTNAWSANSGSAAISRITSDHKFGTASLKIDVTSAIAGARTNGTSVTSGTTYTFSVWVKGVNGNTYRLEAVRADFSTITATVNWTADGTWQKETVSFSAPATETMYMMAKTHTSRTETFWIDGAQLETGSTATDYIETDGATASRFPDSSYGIWQAATNLVTNGGFETNNTNWATGAPAVNNVTSFNRDATVSKFGSASMKVIAPGSVLGEGVRWLTNGTGGIAVSASTAYAYSWWGKGNAGGERVQSSILWYNSSGTFISQVYDAGNVLTTSWARYSLTATSPVGTAYALLILTNYSSAQAATYWIDGVQLETGVIATPYIETNGGTVARSAASVQASTANTLNTTQGWIAMRMRMGYANNSTANKNYIFEWGDNSSNRITCQWDNPDGNIWLCNRVSGGTGNSVSVGDTFASGDSITAIFAWTSTQAKLSIKGGAFTSVSNTFIPTLAATVINIGRSFDGSGTPLNSNVLWTAAGNGTLTNADASTLNGYGNTDPTTTQLATLNGGLSNSTFLWTADTTVDTQTSFSQNSARNYTIGSLATEEKGPGPIAYWSFDEGNGPTAKNSNWKKTGTTTNLVANPRLGTGSSGWGVVGGTAVGTRVAIPGQYGANSWEVDVNANLDGGTFIQDGDNNSQQGVSYVTSVFIRAKTAADVGATVTFFGEPRGGGTYEQMALGDVVLTAAGTRVTFPVFTWANSGHTGWSVTFRRQTGRAAPYSFYVTELQYAQASAARPYCDGSVSTQGSHQWNGTANASTSTCDYGTNADLYGTATWQTSDQCISGKCLFFDGTTGYANAGTDNLFNLSSALTITAWVRVPPSSGFRTILAHNRESSDWTGYELSIHTTGVLRFTSENTAGGVASIDVIGTKSVADNKWHFVSVTFDGTTARLYVDGVQNVQGNGTITAAPSGAVTYIGKRGNLAYLNGFIDEPKIYNFARTAVQIQTDFAARGAGQGSSAVLGTKDQSPLSNGLTGYWKMDETSWTNNCSATSVTDSSGNGNNGTACPNSTGPTGGAAGKFGNGGSFDGIDDYTNVPTSTTINSTTNGTFSISVWVKPDTLTSAWRRGIIVQEDYLNSGYRLGFDNGGAPRFWTDQSGGTLTMSSSTAMTINQWNHIVVTYNNQQAYLYLNGVQVGSSTGTYIAGTNAIRAGAPVSEYYSGYLDEIRYYNRTLSSSEVSSLYNFAPGPVSYWNFNEGSGSTINDITGNGNTGTWNGTSGWTQGKYGSGANFATSGPIVITSKTAYGLGIRRSGTFSGWIKPMFFTPIGNYVISDWASNIGMTLRLTNSTTADFYVYPNNHRITPTYTFQTNTWYYLTGVMDGANMYMYINGVLVGTNTLGEDIGDSGANLRFNARGDSSGGGDASVVDEVRVYNYAQTAKQIVSDMNAGHPNVGSPIGSPVGYWKMDEGYGTAANNSGNGGSTLNGAMHNFSSPATTSSGWTQNGKFNKALMFDGTNDTNLNFISISEPAGSPLNITGDVTISVWIKPTSGAFDTSGGQIVRSGQFSNQVYALFYVPSTQHVDFAWYDGAFKANSSTNNSVPLNQWSHIVVVRNGLTSAIYVNGILNATAAVTTPTVAATDSLTIGGSTSSAVHQNFNGAIDEVKVYNYALTGSEVNLDFNHGASQVLGAFSDTSGLTGGSSASNSASAIYCVPGDTTSCATPVGQWSFDENQGTSVNDITGNNNIGTWHGTTQWTQGKYGSAGSFTTSSQYVDVGNSSTLNPASTMTIEFWAYPTSIPNSEQAVVSRYYTSGDATTDYLVEATNSVGWRFLMQQSSLSLTGVAGGTVTLNAWNHVVAVADGTKLRLYVNGVSVATPVSYDGTINTSTRNTTIGRTRTDDTFGNFFGRIDDVKIFNYARSAPQVSWDYNRGGPVGWWKLDECQGTTLNDSSGNGNSATLTVGALTAGTCPDGTGTTIWNKGSIGKRNSSLYFDGTNDYTSAADASNLSFTNNVFSISFWMKSATTGTGMSIFNKNGTSGSNWEYGAEASGTGFQFVARNLGGSNVYASTTQSFETGWAHYVWTGDGTNGRVYKNGVLVDTQAKTANNMGDGIGALEIGRGRTGNAFNGQIDDFRVYNYALTKSQIQNLYNGGAVNFAPVTGTP